MDENGLALLITPRVNLAVESEEATREVIPRFAERSEWVDPDAG